MDALIRTQLIIGREALSRLGQCRVALFGLGGVGGYALEALVRFGIGSFLLVDNDIFSESNLNRQILATRESLGRKKTEVAKQRALSIRPECSIETRDCFFLPETRDSFDLSGFDYIIDAIDTVTGKLALIQAAQEAGVPVISCMGTGNKMDLRALRVAQIHQTSVCPLARVMRREYKKRGLKPFPVVFSLEPPRSPRQEERQWLEAEQKARAKKGLGRKDIPGSSPFVPAAAGLLLAQTVAEELLRQNERGCEKIAP
ncbi:MAG: tRNA threonylcarbamoyladenosine dehydratase [Lachnospiraceae bacterium]|nr:tRNA threonylcarbamoyladenosine dehydratase [Lachnospiraceae bacterium]